LTFQRLTCKIDACHVRDTVFSCEQDGNPSGANTANEVLVRRKSFAEREMALCINRVGRAEKDPEDPSR